MSRKPSSTPPTASPVVAFEMFSDDDRCIVEAGRTLADLGAFGLLLLDRDLRIVRKVGALTSDAAIGEPVTQSLLQLVGLEAEILHLRTQPAIPLKLPSTGVATGDNRSPKLDITAVWNTARDCPMLLLSRHTMPSDIEIELSKQVRARLIAEAEATAKSNDLAEANADLESFAAIVSHDLSEPLRHMRELITAADAWIASENFAAAHQCLAAVDRQSRRMSDMLTALFDYSSIGRKYEAVETVDTGALVREIKNSLPHAGHSISIDGDWPVIATLRAPLDLVIRNLMTNAIQHHDRQNGAVTVTCSDATAALRIAVADDGPGVDPRHHEAMFLPLRTLPGSLPRTLSAKPPDTALGWPPDGSMGTGMGLAAVKKAIAAAHATITVESDPARRRGATFIVTWPKALPA